MVKPPNEGGCSDGGNGLPRTSSLSENPPVDGGHSDGCGPPPEPEAPPPEHARGSPLLEANITEVCRAPTHAPAPGSCNTGVITSDQGALRCAPVRKGAHAPGSSSPEAYFDSLRIDTLKLSAEVNTDSVRSLGADLIQKKRSSDTETITAHDGTSLEVQSHDPNDNRSVLLLGEGIEITAVPIGDTPVPFLAVEFGASWCWNHTAPEIIQWARDFCTSFGIETTRTLVSRMDVCTDVDERFFRSDVGRFEGKHRGALTGTVAFTEADDTFTGLRYQRSEGRPLTFRVYDKRKEVETRDGHTFWNEVWESYDVDENTPVWRVEFEAQRPRLKERGIDTWEDLTQSKIERFWTYCTEDFARMDRMVWERVQSVSTERSADRVEVDPQFDPESLQRQADGCIESAAKGNQTSKADELERLMQRQDEETTRELARRLNQPS